jgi:hypothetical protein
MREASRSASCEIFSGCGEVILISGVENVRSRLDLRGSVDCNEDLAPS